MLEFLTVDNVTKKYDQKIALKDANLSINKGEFVAIVGMSGSGKTTLLRMIAGLESPSSGKIFQENKPITAINQQARVMFQDDRLLPWMTVIENLTFGSKNPEQIKIAKELLATTNLSEFINYYPANLSGGQRQRVALARALMFRPDLLLLDEPLGALDALTRLQMQNLILNITGEKNITTILVTHDISEAVRMANKIIIIKNSQIIATVNNPYQEIDSETGKLKRVQLVDDILDVIYHQ